MKTICRLVLIFLPFSIVQAQEDCPFSNSEMILDTLDVERYFPLAVGNTWEYAGDPIQLSDFISRIEVMSDTLIEGNIFSKVSINYFRIDRYPDAVPALRKIHYISFADSTLIEWHVDTQSISLSGLIPLGLSREFKSCFIENSSLTIVDGGYNTSVQYGEDREGLTIDVAAAKTIDTGFETLLYAADIGLIHQVGDASNKRVLVYADLSERSFGTPLNTLFNISVGVGRSPRRTNSAEISNYPNPFSASTRFSFYLPESSNLDIFVYDITGRLVGTPLTSRTYTQGNHEIFWEPLPDLAPGLYFVYIKNHKKNTYYTHYNSTLDTHKQTYIQGTNMRSPILNVTFFLSIALLSCIEVQAQSSYCAHDDPGLSLLNLGVATKTNVATATRVFQ